MTETRARSRGHMPHWETEGGIYFVTFPLGDSLPVKALRELRAEQQEALRQPRRPGREPVSAQPPCLNRAKAKRVEAWLDGGAGACWLRKPEVAAVVARSIKEFDGVRYRLLAWCVMPNHVHVVVCPLAGFGLAQVVHSWESFSAKEANQRLGRTGPFWMREYYDHLVRDGEELGRIVRSVAENPARAGLNDWPWVEACARL